MARNIDPDILKARKELDGLETTPGYRDMYTIDSIVEGIRKRLSHAGVDASALDENGQRTAREMEDRIAKAFSRAHLISACSQFLGLEARKGYSETHEIDAAVKRIRAHLNKAGKDAAALDGSGLSTAREMEDRIAEAVVRAHLVSARTRFSDLEKSHFPYVSEDAVDEIVDSIREHLAEAGKDASVLDYSGRKTLTEMEDRIAKAVTKAKQNCSNNTNVTYQTPGGRPLTQQSQGAFPKRDVATKQPADEPSVENQDAKTGKRALDITRKMF